jgi:hypothetical protein
MSVGLAHSGSSQRLLGSALLALTALAIAVASCGGAKTNGTLCASCSVPDDEPCESSTLIADEDIGFFCGDASRNTCSDFCAVDSNDLNQNGVTDEYVCFTTLVCAHQDERAARRCYPTLKDGKTPHPNYECDGEKPDPAG